MPRYFDNKDQIIKIGLSLSGSAETEEEETREKETSSMTEASGVAANIEEEN